MAACGACESARNGVLPSNRHAIRPFLRARGLRRRGLRPFFARRAAMAQCVPAAVWHFARSRAASAWIAGHGAAGNVPPTRRGRPESGRSLRPTRTGRYSERVTPKPPAAPEGAWIVFADGAARGNPGPAAYGFVLDDPAGRPQAAEGRILGVATNNVAEYMGLIAGLGKALELGVTALEVRMDSELIVRQMTGVYRVKNAGLKPLFEEAQRLSKSFARFGIAHVRRELNFRADAEANKALDAAKNGAGA